MPDELKGWEHSKVYGGGGGGGLEGEVTEIGSLQFFSNLNMYPLWKEQRTRGQSMQNMGFKS